MTLPSLPPIDISFDMPSNTNVFNACGDEAFDYGITGTHVSQNLTTQMNHPPMFASNNQMSTHAFSSHAPQDPHLLNSMFVSSNHISYNMVNHHGGASMNARMLPSFGSNNQFELNRRMAQQMRRNVISVESPRSQVSSVVDYFPIKDKPEMTHVNITETITKQYSAVIPTNTMLSVQNDISRVKRALAIESNMWNSPSDHVNFSWNVGDPSIDNDYTKRSDLFPKPLNVIFPREANQNHWGNNVDSVSSQSLRDSIHPNSANMSASANVEDNSNSYEPGQPEQPSRRKRTRKPKKLPKDMAGYFMDHSGGEQGESGDDGYDGRTHSLPYEKYGPYTCPRCNNVFNTSQKFAAHMVSAHYRNETNEEKRKRLRARYKKQLRVLNPDTAGAKLGVSEQKGEQEGEKEEAIAKEEDGNIHGTSDGDGCLHDVVVKQEFM